MINMLDIKIDLVYDTQKDRYECWGAVWDGPQYVASKTWIGDDPHDLLRMVTPFWLYWSGLYYDSGDLTPKRYSRDGFEQLRLWDSSSDK